MNKNSVLHIVPYANDRFYKLLFDKIEERHIVQKIYVPCYKGDKRFLNLDDRFVVKDVVSKFLRFFTKARARKAALSFNKSDCNVNLIHAHSLFFGGSIAYYLSKKYNIKYIVAVRSSDVDVFYRLFFWERLFINDVLTGAENIIFISPSLQSKMLNMIKDTKTRITIKSKSIVVPNGIDDFYLKNTYSKQKNDFGDGVSFLIVGKNIRRKKFPETIKLISKSGIAIKRITIIGAKGNDKSEAQLKSNDYVDRIFSMDKKQLINRYREADVFVMLSQRETFGISYIESLSQGTPILYSSNTGVDGFFEEGIVGYRANINKPDEFNSIIKKIINNYSDLSLSCCTNAKKFSWDMISDVYISMYNKIINNKTL